MILPKDDSSAVFNIEKKTNYYYMGDSNLVTHLSTNPAEQGLTSLSGRNMFLVVK